MATKPFNREAFAASPFFAALTAPALAPHERADAKLEARADTIVSRQAELDRCATEAEVKAWIERVQQDGRCGAVGHDTYLRLIAKGCLKSAFMQEGE